jgi:hypothetical protein
MKSDGDVQAASALDKHFHQRIPVSVVNSLILLSIAFLFHIPVVNDAVGHFGSTAVRRRPPFPP